MVVVSREQEIISNLKQSFISQIRKPQDLTIFDLMVFNKFDEMQTWLEGDRKILVEVKCTALKCSYNQDGFCQNETINLELEWHFKEGYQRTYDTTEYSATCEDCDIPTKVHKP